MYRLSCCLDFCGCLILFTSVVLWPSFESSIRVPGMTGAGSIPIAINVFMFEAAAMTSSLPPWYRGTVPATSLAKKILASSIAAAENAPPTSETSFRIPSATSFFNNSAAWMVSGSTALNIKPSKTKAPDCCRSGCCGKAVMLDDLYAIRDEPMLGMDLRDLSKNSPFSGEATPYKGGSGPPAALSILLRWLVTSCPFLPSTAAMYPIAGSFLIDEYLYCYSW